MKKPKKTVKRGVKKAVKRAVKRSATKKPAKKSVKKIAPKKLAPKKAKKALAAAAPKAPAPKKLTKKELQMRDKAEKLYQKGRERGFVTYDEILKEFPSIEDDVMFLEEMYDTLESEGIDVIESGGLLDLGDGGKDDKHTYHREESRYDSIQMYLRDIR